MAVPPAPAEPGLTSRTTSSTESDAPPGTPGGRSARFRRVLLVVLVAVLVASLGAVAWLWSDRRGEADGQQAEREAVMSQARQFMLRVNTYGPEMLDEQGTMPEYRESVIELITPKFRTSFEEQVTVAEQSVANPDVQLARTAEVYGVGVSALDEDSASALVAGAFTNSFGPRGDGERVEDEPTVFRVEVQLVKVDGEWLVDDFGPVTRETEQ